MKIVKSKLDEINTLHAEVVGSMRNAFEKAIRLGELLTEIKEDQGHGYWLPWLKKNTSISERSAQDYMLIFDHRKDFKSATIADLAGAKKLIADKKHTSRVGKRSNQVTEVVTHLKRENSDYDEIDPEQGNEPPPQPDPPEPDVKERIQELSDEWWDENKSKGHYDATRKSVVKYIIDNI